MFELAFKAKKRPTPSSASGGAMRRCLSVSGLEALKRGKISIEMLGEVQAFDRTVVALDKF